MRRVGWRNFRTKKVLRKENPRNERIVAPQWRKRTPDTGKNCFPYASTDLTSSKGLSQPTTERCGTPSNLYYTTVRAQCQTKLRHTVAKSALLRRYSAKRVKRHTIATRFNTVFQVEA